MIGLIFTQRSGSYFLDIFNDYTATLSLLVVALCEVLIISYSYGIERLVVCGDRLEMKIKFFST